jgi:serine phosphatase RsbU (regulator of sigma subunit)
LYICFALTNRNKMLQINNSRKPLMVDSLNKQSLFLVVDITTRVISLPSDYGIIVHQTSYANTTLEIDYSSAFDVILINNYPSSVLTQLITELKPFSSATIFILGDITDQESLLKIHKNTHFIDAFAADDFSFNHLLVQLLLKHKDIQVLREIKALNDKIEMQKMMLADMEQTTNNLVTATWRERDMKDQLKLMNVEIEQSKLELETTHKKLHSSINYAFRIQEAINPSLDDFKLIIPNSFLIYKPKDTISGDFPWLYKKGDDIYLAAVDCTGHGVPGAMMAMIGSLLLNSLVELLEEATPAEILDTLHVSVLNTLRQNSSSSNSNDGMDIALIKINYETKTLEFAGAHRPLYMMSNNEFVEYKGDKFPIGGTQFDRKRTLFNNVVVPFNDGDSVYLFSDGFSDQIGGPENKSFLSKRVTDLIKQVAHLPISEIGTCIENTHKTWMGDNKQVDDILMVGLKF